MSAMPDSTLANPEQRIADLERQLAERTAERDERTAERDEALEQQTATAEVLQVINSSPGDLAPVFDAMLERALRLCEAALGFLFIYDGDQFRSAVTRGATQEFADFLRDNPSSGPPGSDLGLLIAGENVVHRTDFDPGSLPATPHARAFAELGGARTSLMVALRKDSRLIGAVTVYRQEVRPFTDKQIALLQNFAAQAVIAMENARLITETREALEQQTATAEVLGVINSSPGDLAPVFDAMLEKTLRLCEAAHGNFLTYDGEVFHRAAFRGEPQFAEYRRPQGPQRPAEHGQLARMVQGGGTLHRIDAREDEAYRDDPGFRRIVDGLGIRTSLTVPLRKGDALLGAVRAYRLEVRPFTDKQIALVENFAAQAVIAIENARLLTETREALEQQTATAEVLQVINSSPGDLAPVFDAMLEKAMRLCEADYGHVLTFDGQQFHPTAIRGEAGFVEWRRRLGPVRPDSGADASPLGRVMQGERVAQVADATQENAYRTRPRYKELVDTSGIRSQAAVALRKEDALLGAIVVYRREVRQFSEKEIALLENFAAQAVIAMENARLITETREALEQQTATAEVLQVINSSPGDLAPVFEAMVEKAMRLCDAAHGALRTYDGEDFHLVAAYGQPQAVERLQRLPIRPILGSPFELLTRGESVVHIADSREQDLYRNNLRVRERIDLGSIRTWLAVALQKEGLLLGAIIVYRQEVRPFTDKQIALLQNFAAQAVIAMENARLLGELRQRTDEVADLNRGLEARVAEQVEELGRVGRLKRFLAPQLAELIVSQGDEKILESHRRDIVVVFCDLRGYTAFTETAEPEEVLDFLREYHGALGPLVSQYEGTLDQFSGDGIMVFFNDPVPCPDPAERAVKMAMAMREEAGKLIAAWRRDGCELGFGAGIAQGYATLGQIGFSDRSGYTAIGTVCNLAARLCAEAKDGQILISSRVARGVEAVARLENLGNLELKGLRRPVAAFNVVQSPSAGETRPNLTIVARGPEAGS